MTDSIGTQLKRARRHRNLSLEQAAEATRIRPGYLQALETDDYSAMPSPVHARGFLRNYAQYLQLDLDEILEELRAAQKEQAAGIEPDVLFEEEQPAPLPPAAAGAKVETAEPPAEPFWQTWLRRAKSEMGELEAKEEPATMPHQGVAVPAKTDRKTVEPAQTEVTKPGLASKTEKHQTIEREGTENGAKADLLIDRMKSLIPKRQPKPSTPVEIRAEPGPQPEPEPEPEPEPPLEPISSSQEIINEIGQQLRRRREMLSLTLDEIERHTRLRAEIMEALESGNFDNLPSPVQTRGMLANYAGFLDLEVDALLLRYADALQARHRERYPVKPARRRGRAAIPKNLPPFRTFIAGDVVFGIGMILLLIGFSVWGISRVITYQSEQSSEGQVEGGPSISEALIGTPVETVFSEVTLIPVEDTPIPELPAGTEGSGEVVDIPPLESSANVQVNIVALERSFLRVMVDGEVKFEGRTIPGNAYAFEAEQSVEVLAGNGAALRVLYNQRDMGLMGGFGQIASFIYTPEEVLVPTPAMSPTVTSTPFISPTPSITPSPTITPAPTLTPSDIGVEV